MTLALIVLFALSGNGGGFPNPSFARPQQSTTQQPAADSQGQSTTGNGEQTQGTTPPSSPSASTPSQTPSTHPKAPVRHKRRKKRVSVQNCDTNAPGTSSASPQTGGSQTANADAATKGQTAPTPCPPPKIIVRHGGTSEPSIQLAGDQPPNEREDTNRLLSATDANLKKLEGRQLNANQQDMVGQVRQFMQQSRSAMGSGDFARSRTLAWKAQLLSEELVKPSK